MPQADGAGVCTYKRSVMTALHSLLLSFDCTAAYLSRADVERRCSFLSCRPKNHLKIYYLGIDAKPATISISEAYLRDSVSTISDYINDMKGRTNSSSLF